MIRLYQRKNWNTSSLVLFYFMNTELRKVPMASEENRENKQTVLTRKI